MHDIIQWYIMIIKNGRMMISWSWSIECYMMFLFNESPPRPRHCAVVTSRSTSSARHCFQGFILGETGRLGNHPDVLSLFGGVHSHGDPQARWMVFLNGKIPSRNGWFGWGYPYDSGNSHLGVSIVTGATNEKHHPNKLTVVRTKRREFSGMIRNDDFHDNPSNPQQPI